MIEVEKHEQFTLIVKLEGDDAHEFIKEVTELAQLTVPSKVTPQTTMVKYALMRKLFMELNAV